MKFYAAKNRFASQTDKGFANTWYVLAFESRKARDEHVNYSRDLATRSIKKHEIGALLRASGVKPRPFSNEYYAIRDMSWQFSDGESYPNGCIGEIAIANSFIEEDERLYK